MTAAERTLPPTGRPRPPRRRRSGSTGSSWRGLLWRDTPTSVLVDEADRLIDGGRLKDAVRVLGVAAGTLDDPDARRPVLERLAVTAADAGRHDVSREAVLELQGMDPQTPGTWVAYANVALARGNHLHADRAARSALDGEPGHHGAWAALAAAYAGLGWFDQVDDCLDRLDRNAMTGRERWRIGRAVNRWAMSDTGWLVLGAVAALLFGALALVVVAAAPLVARTVRLRALRLHHRSGADLAAMAGQSWRSATRLRLAHGLVLVAAVAACAALLVLT